MSMLCEYSEGAQLCFERVWSKKQPVEVIKIVNYIKVRLHRAETLILAIKKKLEPSEVTKI